MATSRRCVSLAKIDRPGANSGAHWDFPHPQSNFRRMADELAANQVSSAPDPDVDRAAERRAIAIATIEAVEHAIAGLLLDREVFKRFADAVNGSLPVKATPFPWVVARWYTQSVLLGLRRLGDKNPKTYSLRALFDRMIVTPADWSFNAIMELWSSDDHPYDSWGLHRLVSIAYKEFAAANASELNVARVERDRTVLESTLHTVKAVVDKTIAHAERHGGAAPAMTFNDLDAAITTCETIAKPYIALLTGRGYAGMTPIPPDDWWRIFSPWRSIS